MATAKRSTKATGPHSMKAATGTTEEGTTWRTRPWSESIKADYTCVRHGGRYACHSKMGGECRSLGWIGDGGKAKPYSPATPSIPRPAGIPSSVGDYQATFATARLRLDGLEPWPEHRDVAPRLSQQVRPDAAFRKLYREFLAACSAARVSLFDMAETVA